jgi:hypothetical protein
VNLPLTPSRQSRPTGTGSGKTDNEYRQTFTRNCSNKTNPTPPVPNQRPHLRPKKKLCLSLEPRIIHRPPRRRLAPRTPQRHPLPASTRHQHNLRRSRRHLTTPRPSPPTPPRSRDLRPPPPLHKHLPQRRQPQPRRNRPPEPLQPQQSPQEPSPCLADFKPSKRPRLLHLARRPHASYH